MNTEIAFSRSIEFVHKPNTLKLIIFPFIIFLRQHRNMKDFFITLSQNKMSKCFFDVQINFMVGDRLVAINIKNIIQPFAGDVKG
jgi:hypothetical protein